MFTALKAFLIRHRRPKNSSAEQRAALIAINLLEQDLLAGETRLASGTCGNLDDQELRALCSAAVRCLTKAHALEPREPEEWKDLDRQASRLSIRFDNWLKIPAQDRAPVE